MAKPNTREGGKPAQKQQGWFRETFESLVWAVVLTALLRAFLIQAFTIPSESMVPTLLIGDYMFVNRFEYGPKIPFTHVRLPGLRKPQTGDIIVFQWPLDPRQDWVKRCIATGGQVVEVRNKVVFVDGKPSPLADRFAQHVDPDTSCGPEVKAFPEDPTLLTCRDNFGPYRVPPGRLFMMGDNRENSLDSRWWGTVPLDYVKGRAMFLYWSTAGRHWWDAAFHLRWERLLRPLH